MTETRDTNGAVVFSRETSKYVQWPAQKILMGRGFI